MTSALEGIGRFVPFLLASLLLHLAAILAVLAVHRWEPADRETTNRMTVEYLGTSEIRGGPPEKEARGSVPSGRTKYAAPLAAKGADQAPGPKRQQAQGDGPGEKHGAANMPSTPPVGVSPKLPHVRQDASSGAAAIGVGSGGENGAAPKTAGTGEGPALRSGGGARGSGSGGSGGSGILSPAAAARRGAYEALLKRLIEEHKEYPPAARRTRLEGSCLRRFTLGRGGSLRRVESLSSCGHAYLDEAATCAITAVGAFPPLPEEFGGPEATFSVSIKFTLK